MSKKTVLERVIKFDVVTDAAIRLAAKDEGRTVTEFITRTLERELRHTGYLSGLAEEPSK